MRIIGGARKGHILKPPVGLPVRPTTDRAKESIFQILELNYDFSECSVLDLFAGTGNITFEFASRGALSVTSVDADNGCCKHIRQTAGLLNFDQIDVIRSDVFRFLKTEKSLFNIIFADPPYRLPNISEIKTIIFENGLLDENGQLIIEHDHKFSFGSDPMISDKREYGQSAFTFFKKIK